MAAGLEIVCAAALVLPIPLPTAAPGARQDPSSAEALYEAGRTAYRLGHFADAIDKWTRAYAEDPLPSFLFNIALAHQRQYELTGSVEHLHQGKAVLERFSAAAAEDPVSLSDPPLVAISNLPWRTRAITSSRPRTPPCRAW